MEPKWRTVSIPNTMFQEIEKIVEKEGYASVGEWVREVIRQKLKDEKMNFSTPKMEAVADA